MKRIVWMMLAIASCIGIKAEDGSRLWLRYDKVQKAQVTGPECIAAEELRNYYSGDKATLVIDPTIANDDTRVPVTTPHLTTALSLLFAYAIFESRPVLIWPLINFKFFSRY